MLINQTTKQKVVRVRYLTEHPSNTNNSVDGFHDLVVKPRKDGFYDLVLIRIDSWYEPVLHKHIDDCHVLAVEDGTDGSRVPIVNDFPAQEGAPLVRCIHPHPPRIEGCHGLLLHNIIRTSIHHEYDFL